MLPLEVRVQLIAENKSNLVLECTKNVDVYHCVTNRINGMTIEAEKNGTRAIIMYADSYLLARYLKVAPE